MKNLTLILTSILFFGSGLFFIIQESTKRIEPSVVTQKIEQDLNVAKIQNFFPPTIEDLSQIKITIHTRNSNWKKKILQSILLPFAKNPDGKYSMQIDVIENFEPVSEALLILQFNIFENKTKNKIWENSRIYHLSPEDLKDFSQPASQNQVLKENEK